MKTINTTVRDRRDRAIDLVRSETFDEVKNLARRLHLSPKQLARLCRRLKLDTVALASYVKTEVLGR